MIRWLKMLVVLGLLALPAAPALAAQAQASVQAPTTPAEASVGARAEASASAVAPVQPQAAAPTDAQASQASAQAGIGASARQPQAPRAAVSGGIPGLLSPLAAAGAPRDQTSDVVRLALVLSLAAMVPAIVLCMTPFVRLIVVLSMIRHGLGMPETPPNPVLVSLALFLTAFAMAPTLSSVNSQALTPFLEGRMAVEQALDQGAAPLRGFMLRQVRDQDLKAVYDIARQPLPARARDVGTLQLTSAFMLNELRVAFKIGFVVLLPFLLIDLVVSSVLLALGMMMVPPSSIALPIKVLLFVLIDGWSLVLGGVIGSFR